MGGRGFTLIELLIVVAILGVVAGIAIPAYLGQIADVRQASLDANLGVIRKAIEIYAADHGGVWPGYPGGDTAAEPTEAALLNQMMLKTTREGRVDPSGPCGPYLRTEMGFPRNPLSDSNKVAVFDEAAPSDLGEEFGWVYIASTGEFNSAAGDAGEGGAGGAEGGGVEDALAPGAAPGRGAARSL